MSKFYLKHLNRLVIIWRRDTTRVMYDWFDETWVKIDDEAYTDNDKEFDEDHLVQESNYNKTRQRLEEKIQYLLRSTDALQYEAVIKDLLDEHAQGLISKVFSKLALCLEIASDHLTHEHIMPAVSVVGTVLFILAIGHFMAGLVKVSILLHKTFVIELFLVTLAYIFLTCLIAS